MGRAKLQNWWIGHEEDESHSIMSDPATPWTIAHQAPLPMEFSRQEYWSGLPFPSPGDLLNPRIEPGSPALQAGSLPSEPPAIGHGVSEINDDSCVSAWNSWKYGIVKSQDGECGARIR